MRNIKSLNKRWIWNLVAVIYICIIYGHSLMPADQSSAESGFVLQKLLGLFDAVGISGAWLSEHLVRKTAHFMEYAVVGLLLRPLLKTNGLLARYGVMAAVFFGFLIPFVDETIQLFVEGRAGQISDVWLDISGVLTGYLMAALIKKVMKG